MNRKFWLLLGLMATTPAWSVDALSCLEDGNSIELSGTVINEHHGDQTPLVLLSDQTFCRTEYSFEQADYVVTNTNVMRFQLLPGPKSRQNLASFAGKEVVARGLVYKASAAEHRTPLIIEIQGVVVK